MRVQKFEGLTINNKVFKAHSNETNKYNNTRTFHNMDSVDKAMESDSIENPILPQLLAKLKNAYGLIFSKEVVNRAKEIKSDINSVIESKPFQQGLIYPDAQKIDSQFNRIPVEPRFNKVA